MLAGWDCGLGLFEGWFHVFRSSAIIQSSGLTGWQEPWLSSGAGVNVSAVYGDGDVDGSSATAVIFTAYS